MVKQKHEKQISLSTFSDKMAQVQTKKKEFLTQMDRIIPWWGMDQDCAAVLVQRRARKQALRSRVDAASLCATKSV